MAYLQWAVKDYTPGSKKRLRSQDTDTADTDTNEQTPNDDTNDTPATTNPPSINNTTSLHHHIAKNLPFVRTGSPPNPNSSCPEIQPNTTNSGGPNNQ